MHRFIIVALVAVLAASCDRFPDNGLQIGGMLPFDDDCAVDPGTDLRRSGGVWDVGVMVDGVALSTNYLVTPLLENYIVSRATDIQAQQNNLQVTNLEILLQTPDGLDLVLPAGLPNPYTTTASSSLPVAEDGSFTSGSTISIAVPADYEVPVRNAVDAAGFTQLIIVIRAIGTTMGGFTQKSAAFFWPVTLCEGCLDICAAGVELTDAQVTELDASCSPGQDTFVYCSDTSLIPMDSGN